MPFYSYACADGHRCDVFLTLSHHVAVYPCRECALEATQVITAPLFVSCAVDVCYDSPIDGRPITSHQARIEDMKRNNCTEYDPGQKTDANNRLKASDDALDRQIDQYAESVTEKMTTAQRGKIYSELTEQGKTTEILRTSL